MLRGCSVCVCVCVLMLRVCSLCVCGCSGGRNITVTGAGFDLIQSATMLVMPSKDEASNQSGSVRVSPSTNYHTNQLTNYTHNTTEPHTHTHTPGAIHTHTPHYPTTPLH